eukprot:787731-Rhodomonas_salina.1
MSVLCLRSVAYASTGPEQYGWPMSVRQVMRRLVLTEDITLRGSRMGSGLRAEGYSLKGLGLRA